MEEKTQMSGTAVHRYELEYQKLADLTTSSFEVRSATEFFIEYPQERERAGEWSVLRAIGDQALRHEPLVVEKAVWALAHLEAWEQLGSLASAVIASAEQLDWRFRSSFDRFRGKDREPSPLWTLERALVKCLAKPINTDPLWPALQPYFRLKDQEIRRRAIDLVG